MIVYLSGPITGLRDNNRRAFTKALDRIGELALAEIFVISPLQLAEKVEAYFGEYNRNQYHVIKPEWSDYMRLCIARLCTVDCVYFLKNWQKSKGASLERHIAESLDIPCVESAEELKKIYGERHADQRKISDYKSLLSAR
ncbi:hypothetical protein AGMMS50268_09610 [Spirochaetia bacterium]|nr:hypothetical protein AGMMS50268_09610 [Spirochaetia bacterium]